VGTQERGFCPKRFSTPKGVERISTYALNVNTTASIVVSVPRRVLRGFLRQRNVAGTFATFCFSTPKGVERISTWAQRGGAGRISYSGFSTPKGVERISTRESGLGVHIRSPFQYPEGC